MKLAVLFMLFGLALASDVLDLTNSNFDEDIKKFDLLLVKYYKPGCPFCKAVAPKFEEAATILKESHPLINLVEVDCFTEVGKEICQKQGVTIYPTINLYKKGEFVVQFNKNIQSFDLTTDMIVDFMKAQAINTQSIESTEDMIVGSTKSQGSILVATYETFDKVVIRNTKDCLILFYSPVCPRSKAFAPIYEELSRALAGENEVDLIKMDAQKSTLYGFGFPLFPGVFWLPKNAKSSPVRFDAEKTLENLIKFVAEKATNELKGYDRNGNKK